MTLPFLRNRFVKRFCKWIIHYYSINGHKKLPFWKFQIDGVGIFLMQTFELPQVDF